MRITVGASDLILIVGLVQVGGLLAFGSLYHFDLGLEALSGEQTGVDWLSEHPILASHRVKDRWRRHRRDPVECVHLPERALIAEVCVLGHLALVDGIFPGVDPHRTVLLRIGGDPEIIVGDPLLLFNSLEVGLNFCFK